ncbi:MAG: hypothetical protein EOP64_02865 [Sphingomonas sp.]|nr:MAG: hypothetical protein EOP64_02865 [Sphingomonas sp.]
MSRSVSGVQEVVLRVPAVLVDVGGGGVGRVAILAVLIVVTVVGSGGDRRLEASEVHGDRLEGAGGARGDGVGLGGGTAGLGGLLQINKVRHGRATHRRPHWTMASSMATGTPMGLKEGMLACGTVALW